MGRSLYEIGTRLAHIADVELWRAAGHRTFEEYLERDVGFSRTTAYRLMRIARSFDGTIVARHGVEKLDLAVRYLRMAKTLGLPHDGMKTALRIRDERGRFVVRRLAEAGPDEIRSAITELRNRPAPRAIDPSTRERMKALEDGLPAAPPGTVRGPRIRLRRAKDGRVAITFRAIPADDLATFIRAIQQHLENDT